MASTKIATRGRLNTVDEEDLFRQAYRKHEAGAFPAARRMFLLSAKQGDVNAQAMLGYIYDTGVGIKKNRKTALLWYTRAYTQGSRMAASNIGTVYRDEGNLDRALIWFHRAVRLRDGDANLEIAKILLSKGRPKRVIISYLKRTLRASKLDVTQGSREEARKFLKTLAKGGSE